MRQLSAFTLAVLLVCAWATSACDVYEVDCGCNDVSVHSGAGGSGDPCTPIDRSISWADFTAQSSTTLVGSFGRPGSDMSLTITASSAFLPQDGVNYFVCPACPATYTIDPLVPNPPTQPPLVRFNAVQNIKLQLSEPVSEIILALVSIGQGSVAVPLSVSSGWTAVVLKTGTGHWGAGTVTQDTPQQFTGREGHGLVRLTADAPTDELTIQVLNGENWSGFTYGVPIEEDCSSPGSGGGSDPKCVTLQFVQPAGNSPNCTPRLVV